MVEVGRVYEQPDGATRRVLVDRLWPRGITKERLALDLWLKDAAPSDRLRRWYGHKTERWDAFRERYRAELAARPDVVDVQVIGVPDPRYGEEVMAWVKLRDGAPALREEDVRSFCRGRIAHFKVPRYVRFADEFPMTVTGKIQKFKLREAAIAELGLEAAATTRNA